MYGNGSCKSDVSPVHPKKQPDQITAHDYHLWETRLAIYYFFFTFPFPFAFFFPFFAARAAAFAAASALSLRFCTCGGRLVLHVNNHVLSTARNSAYCLGYPSDENGFNQRLSQWPELAKQCENLHWA